MAAVDFAYLETFLAHDHAIVGEVLTIFAEQARSWSSALADPADGWRDLAHTIKGAARGIGAQALSEAAARAETGELSDLPALQRALDEALAEIALYRAKAA
jgi:HPt (histidine-containing phosphotransfer) domain-containing protein